MNEASANRSGVHAPRIAVQVFPDPPHRNDEYVHFINDYLPMVLLVSFMLAVASICKDLVAEKEKKLKVTYSILRASARRTAG